jgi:hypothetical protein
VDEHEREEVERRLRALFSDDVELVPPSVRPAGDVFDLALRRERQRRARLGAAGVVAVVVLIVVLTAWLVP